MVRTALILSGEGRYADPWHPFAETSAHLAQLLQECGIHPTLESDVDGALRRFRDPDAWPDLLVVNVGEPRDGYGSPAGSDELDGLDSILRGSVPLLAVHVSATSFTNCESWESAMAGRWVRGTTMHPAYGTVEGRLEGSSDHVILHGLDDFTVEDEAYSYLRVTAGATVLVRHELDGIGHPLVWVRERDVLHSSRSAYDALGHDSASYRSAMHRQLLKRTIHWLLDSGAPRTGAARSTVGQRDPVRP
ncbi:ThuA domain-containing protein [Microbacteriaceae bacterium VKM Ac-2855]|nr:ThuA domain-containing protein [Microbacteriaceae bacterium VKM Ac-2855]